MKQMIFLLSDGRNKGHRDCGLLMVSGVVVELKVRMRLLITCFLVFTASILMIKGIYRQESILCVLCELRERRLEGGSTLNSCVMK